MLSIVVKQFSEPFNGRTPFANAQAEVETHLLAWSYMTEDCRSHLAVPACMDWEQAEGQDVNEWYTVQASVEEEGLRLDDAFTFLILKAKGRLRKLPVAKRREIASSFGQMLACIHEAGLNHRDLHADNVLVLHNLPYDTLTPIDAETFVVKWRVIDWGGGGLGKAEWNRDAWKAKTGKLCGWESVSSPWLAMPAFEWKTVDDHGGVVMNCTKEWRHVLELMMNALGDYNMERYEPVRLKLRHPQVGGLPFAGPVTDTVVAQWVRQAYAKGLNIEIPDALQEIVEQRLLEQEELGGAGRMPDV